MTGIRTETIPLTTEADVVIARREVKTWATRIGFGLVDQTKLVTACSELARNTLVYGGGGNMTLDEIENFPKRGLRLTFIDQGPGIADIEQALTDGYTSGGGMGLGLSGAKRLSNEFEIESSPGHGTRVMIARWK